MSIQFKSHQRSWWIVHNRPTQKALSPGPESHQRSWWFVHTLPTQEALSPGPESHQRSWWIVHNRPTQKALSPGPEFHQRSWWIVHIRPTPKSPERFRCSHEGKRVAFTCRLQYEQSTNCVGGIRYKWRQSLLRRQSMNEPPTARWWDLRHPM